MVGGDGVVALGGHNFNLILWNQTLLFFIIYTNALMVQW